MTLATPLRQPWTERRHKQTPSDPAKRTEFALDRDRILHSRAFRRLQHKTQVFVVTEADFFRTRMTHSLEVAQIGRGIAYELGLDETLSEAIALAHDLGHGPFGHEGEEILDELMRDHGGWHANHHSLVVVEEIESPQPGYRGLNLTWATREGIARHATRFDIPTSAGDFDRYPQPGAEAQAISEADECAYVAHDVEDAVNAGLLKFEDLRRDGPDLWRRALNAAEELCAENSRPDLGMDLERVMLRRATSIVIKELIGDVVRATEQRIREGKLRSSGDVRERSEPTISASVAGRLLRDSTTDFMMERVYRHPSVMRQVARGKMVLTRLFDKFVENPGLLPRSTQEKLSIPGSELHQIVARFIAGMTDRFALDTHAEIFEPPYRGMTGRPD